MAVGSFQAYLHLLTKCDFIIFWKCKSIHDYFFFIEFKIQQIITSSKHTPQHSQAFHAVQIAFIHSEDMSPVCSSLLLISVALRRILEKRSLLKELIN